MKFNNLGCTLNRIFLFFDAFLSTSFTILVRFLFYRYFNVSFTKKSLSSFYRSCQYVFCTYCSKSISSQILLSVVSRKFYSGSKSIRNGDLFCWHFLLTFYQSLTAFFACPTGVCINNEFICDLLVEFRSRVVLWDQFMISCSTLEFISSVYCSNIYQSF